MGRRQRNEERTKRFQQVKDNQRKKDDDADLDKQYADMAAKVSLIVEERRLAEHDAHRLDGQVGRRDEGEEEDESDQHEQY